MWCFAVCITGPIGYPEQVQLMLSFTRHVKEIASSTLTPSCVHQWRSSGKYPNQQLAPILALHSTSRKLVRHGELSFLIQRAYGKHTHTYIYICAVGDGGALKAFPAFLFSKSRELDATMIGTHAPRSVVDEPSQNSHRIRTLEIHLYSSHYIRQHTEEISPVIWSGTLITSAR